MASFDTKFVAFYLPQFHPIPENDKWWGKGFTEWTNVTKASPLFAGHYQPHLPADLGFYDLRLTEVMHDQAELAKRFGIDGFCFHYYWFSGTRLLHKPLDSMLADRTLDMPFCLCWANENWTRRWDAAEHELLISQKYLPNDDIDFIKSVEPFLRDDRYIKVDGAPILIVYRPQQLPNPKSTAARWRAYCDKIGIGKIHLCAALTHGNWEYERFGFDSGVEFPPHNWDAEIQNDKLSVYRAFKGNLVKYIDVAKYYIDKNYGSSKVFNTVVPSWDNTARVNERALVLLNGTPGNYEYWLGETVKNAVKKTTFDRELIFINSWNEWAEGCHLEPDQKFGLGFLQSTLAVKEGSSELKDFPDDQIIGVDIRATRRTVIKDIAEVVQFHSIMMYLKTKVYVRKRPNLRKVVVWVRNLLGSRAKLL